MAPRNPGLAGIVRSPTVATVNRTGLSPAMQNLLGALDKAGYGDVGFNSGYRSPSSNAKARGAKNSQHLTGNAGDFNTAGMSPDRVLGMMGVAAANNVNGIGLYSTGNSLHLDTRNGPRAVWGINGSYRSAPPSAFPAPFQGFVTNFLGQRVPAAVNPVAPIERAALPTTTIDRYGASMRPTPRPGQPQQTSTGLGLPDAPAAPDQPGVFSQGGFIDRNRGALAGGLLGTIAGGPIGGLLGGFLGNAAQNARMGTPSETARSALDQGWDGVSAQPGVSQANVVERRSLPDLPTTVPGQPAPSMPGYAGQPAVPGAPEQPGFMGRVTAPQNRGALVGSILGNAERARPRAPANCRVRLFWPRDIRRGTGRAVGSRRLSAFIVRRHAGDCPAVPQRRWFRLRRHAATPHACKGYAAAMTWGGQREGAGRKAGSGNRLSKRVLEALGDKQSPAEYMLTVLHDENASADDRRWAAEKLAPYIHAKPAPAQRTVQINLPAADTAEGVKAAFAKLIAATAAGELAPSEATALAGLIESQRKAIEMADVLGRLEELEEFQKNAHKSGRRA